MKDNSTYIDDRLTIEKRLTCLEVKVKEIAENHLVHIEAKIDRINWLLIVTLIGLVANLLQRYL